MRRRVIAVVVAAGAMTALVPVSAADAKLPPLCVKKPPLWVGYCPA